MRMWKAIDPTALGTRVGAGAARAEVVQGLRDAMPVVLAYVPVGATYGVVATSAHLPLWITLLGSVVIYAGAAQFMLVSLSVAGVAALPLSVALLLVNLRHALYGTSIGTSFARWSEGQKWLAGFGLTDEVFAVSGAHAARDAITPAYQLALSFACYAAWVSGSAAGALIGGLVPTGVAAVLTYALPALFLALVLGVVQASAQRAAPLAAALCGAVTAVMAELHGSVSAGIVAGGVVGATVGLVVSRWLQRPMQTARTSDN